MYFIELYFHVQPVLDAPDYLAGQIRLYLRQLYREYCGKQDGCHGDEGEPDYFKYPFYIP